MVVRMNRQRIGTTYDFRYGATETSSSVFSTTRVVLTGLPAKYGKDALVHSRAEPKDENTGQVLRLEDFAAYFIVLTSGVFIR